MPLDAIAYDAGCPYLIPYRRVSSKGQLKGRGIERQVGHEDDGTTDQDVADKLGMPLGEPLIDPGLSAYRGVNLFKGVLGAMLDRLDRGEIPSGSILITDEWTRLTRMKLTEANHLVNGMLIKGLGIYVKKTSTLLTKAMVDGPGGSIIMAMALVALGAGHDESKEKGRKVSDSKRGSHEEAAKNGRPPTKMTPFWLAVEGGSYKADLNRKYVIVASYVVNRIFDESVNRGVVAIARGLQADWEAGDERCKPPGLYLKNGRTSGWYPGTITTILHNRAVLGWCKRTKLDPDTGRKAPVEGSDYKLYPAVITQTQWDRAHAEIDNRRKPGVVVGKGGRKGEGLPNILTGMGHCVACGEPMTFRNSRPGISKSRPSRRNRTSFSYLQCRGARMGKGCTMMYRPAYPWIERGVIRKLSGAAIDPTKLPGARPTETKEEIAKVTARLAFITKRSKDIQNDEMLDWDLVQPQLAAFTAEKKEIDGRIRDLQKKLDAENGTAGPGEAFEKVSRYGSLALTGDVEARHIVHAALRHIIQEVLLSDGQLHVVLKYGMGILSFVAGQDDPILYADPAMQEAAMQIIAREHPGSLAAAKAVRKRVPSGSGPA
jgi:hypothetical protein